jgi:ribonuclease P protein component
MSVSTGPKNHQKLWRSREFRDIYSKGLKVHGPRLTLYYMSNQLGLLRLGLSVRKKSFKLSTQRHLVQRRLRENFRLNRRRFLPGYDIVISARRFNEKWVLSKELQSEFLDLAQKAGLLKNGTG